MKYVAWIDEKKHDVEIELRDGSYAIKLDGRKHEVDARRIPGTSVYSLLIGGKSYEADVRADGDLLNVSIQGEIYRISLREELWARIAASTAIDPGHGVHELKAPMPGMVVEVRTTVGAKVEKGKPVIVVEAMKMQNEICAPATGTVKRIDVKEHDIVDPARVLLVIESRA